jgi:hypothetical protein
MTDATIAQVCTEARALILREGWTTGGEGWHGYGGWCVEGALGRALGIEDRHGDNGDLCQRVNDHPAGVAIRVHIGLPRGRALSDWNDRSASKGLVLQVLAEVAAKFAPEPAPVWEFVAVNEAKPVTRWELFTAWFNGPLGASTTTPEPEPPDGVPEPSEDPETPSEDLPVTFKELTLV